MSDLQQGRTYLTVQDVATFGERLDAVLEESGVSGQELARRLGHPDARQVRRWRNSPTAPRFETIEEIARSLGVSLDRFSDPWDGEERRQDGEPTEPPDGGVPGIFPAGLTGKPATPAQRRAGRAQGGSG